MKQVVAAIVLCIGIPISQAQNAFGTLHSNYTPTNSLYINPSSMLDAKTWLDINIVGAGVYGNNNAVYLENESWLSVISRARGNGRQLTENDVLYHRKPNNYHAYNRNFVAAPSAVWSQGDFAAGLSIGGRSYTGIRRVPEYVVRFIENGVQQFTEQHNIDYSMQNRRMASLNFAEVKGSFAYTFLKERDNMFMGGITLSKFFSVAGGAANIYDFNANVNNDSLMAIGNLRADMMYTPDPRLNPNGGWGFDIGFTYQKMLGDATSYYPNSKRSGCKELPYLYKIGVSIIDIGSVKFDESDIRFAGYDFSSYDWQNYADAQLNEENAVDIFAEQESNIGEGQVRKPNKIRLPTFASVQFDYNVWASRFYINGTIIQGLPVGKRQFGIRHANSLSITPRFESYWFEFALPMSLYEYRYPQLGASVRIGPVSIGSDKILSWFNRSKLFGGDIYLYAKIPIARNPKCNDNSRASGSGGPKNRRGRLKKRKPRNKRRKYRGSPTDCTY